MSALINRITSSFRSSDREDLSNTTNTSTSTSSSLSSSSSSSRVMVSASKTAEGRKRLDEIQRRIIARGIRYPSIESQCPSQIRIDSSKLTPEISNELIDLIKGLIYGCACGDAIGVDVEFKSKEQAIEKYGSRGPIDYHLFGQRWVPGDWTDDTDQLIVILDMLLAHGGGVNIHDFAARLQYWVHHGFSELGDDRGYGCGSLTMHVSNDSRFIESPHIAAHHHYYKSNGRAAANGALMRTAILGIPSFHDLTTVVENTRQIAATTHTDPRCIASCIICTVLTALQLQHVLEAKSTYDIEADISTAIKYGIDTAFKESTSGNPPSFEIEHRDEWRAEIEQCCRFNISSLNEFHLDERHGIGYTLKCLGAAIYCYRHGQNFRDMITELVLEGGDADTNAAVAGALLGCKLGYKQLDQKWVDGLIEKEWLNNRIERFLKLLGLAEEEQQQQQQTPERQKL